MQKNILFQVLIAAPLLFFPLLTRAEVIIQFENGGNATTTQGTIVTLAGTINNNSTTTLVNINFLSDIFLFPLVQSSSTAAEIFPAETAQSFDYLPESLGPGQQYQGPLVKVDIGATTTPLDYWGIYNLLGGDSIDATTSLASQLFYVHVIGLSPPAPTNPIQAPTPGQTATSTDLSSFSGLQMPGGLQLPGMESNSVSGDFSVFPTGPRLIKLQDETTVYWVSGNNIKIPMTSAKVFLSYKNKWSDVQTVSQQEFDYYQTAKYIWLNGKGAIYEIESGVKRYIPPSVWNPAGINPDKIIWVNKTDFNSYKTGQPVRNGAEMLGLAQPTQ